MSAIIAARTAYHVSASPHTNVLPAKHLFIFSMESAKQYAPMEHILHQLVGLVTYAHILARLATASSIAQPVKPTLHLPPPINAQVQ